MAEESLRRASAKAAEYEAAMREARAEVYQAQEQLHRQLEHQRARDLHAARERTEGMIRDARGSLQADVDQAKSTLAAESDRIAERIAEAILKRRTA